MSSNRIFTQLGQNPKWLLYIRRPIKPLAGFVHASTREEAISWATAHGWPNAIAVPAEAPYPSEPRMWIERDFKLLGTIIPASSADTRRGRTSYFYRREAIAWARLARRQSFGGTFTEMNRKIAKQHLAYYRARKRGNSAPQID